MKHPFLVAPDLYLRALSHSDLSEAYLDWFNDPEVTALNSHGKYPNSEPKMKQYLENLSPTRDLVLAIIDKKTERHLGNVSLQHIDPINRQAEFAILIGDKTAWGKGVGRSAAELVVAHGFNELNLHRIYCGTLDGNKGMMGIATGIGMKEEGRRRAAVFKDGKYLDVIEYGILREEFTGGRTK